MSSLPIFEMKTYTCYPGRLPALSARFESLTLPLWKKHGIQQVAFFEKTHSRVAFESPVTNSAHADTMVYILKWESEEERVAKWAAFVSDPEWVSGRPVTELPENGGPIVEAIYEIDLSPLAFSMLK